jgi:hypothetical protein
MIAWRDLAASSVTTSATKGLQRNCITLEEVVDETMRLLSLSAQNTIEEIPVFTDWVESNLSAPLKRQKKTSWKWYKPSSRHQYYEERK